MTTGRPTPSVREEAHPLTADELTDQQRDAVIDTVGRLRRLASRASSAAPPRTERTRFLVHIDAERSNHVLMIEGARGSGKTSAMVTLLYALLKLLEKERPGLGDLEVDSSISILPLPILDVRPLPKDVALLPMLLGSFQGVVESLPESETSTKPGQFRPQNTSRALFERMMQAATIGWSVPAARALSGEAAMADIEMRKTDRLRRDLLPAFQAFVEQLAKDVEQAHGYKRPFFVIPVDDLDMNPGRTPEMLDLLRTLVHPRLAFVVTADRALMKATMVHEFMRELNPMDGMGIGLVEKAGTLATAHVTKIVPVENAASLPILDPPQALDLFKRLLKALQSDFANEKRPAARLPGDDPRTWALPRHPRALQELAAFIAGHHRASRRISKRAVVIAAAWNPEVERHEYGYIGWAERLRDRIGLSGENFHVDGAMFVPRARVEVPLSLRIGSIGFGAAIQMRWEVVARGVALSEIIEVKDPTQRTSFDAGTDILLPEPLPHFVMAAINELGDGSGIAATFARRMVDAPHVAVTHFEPGGIALHLRWPTPLWTTVGQVLTFTSAFERRIAALNASSPEAQRAAIARLFLQAIVDTLVPEFALANRTELDLAAAIRVLRRSGNVIAQEYVRDRLHLLATPEAGLASEDANTILYACIEPNRVEPGENLAPEWTIDGSLLAAARKAWVGAALELVGRGHLVPDLSKVRPGFDWFALQAVSQPNELWERFKLVLQRIHYVDRNELVGDARRELFLAAQPDHQRRLLRDAQGMAATRHGLRGLARFLAQLWKVWALPNDRKLVVVDRVGALRVQPNVVLSWEPIGERHIRCSETVTLETAQAAMFSRRETRLQGADSLIELLYRLAWDVSVMQAPQKQHGPFMEQVGSVRFAGIRSAQEDGRSSPACWFGPPTPNLYFWERLVEAWNEVQHALVEDRTFDEQQEFVDGLAMRWIRAFPDNPQALAHPQQSDFSSEGQEQTVYHALNQRMERNAGGWTTALLEQFAMEAPGLSTPLRNDLRIAVAKTVKESR